MDCIKCKKSIPEDALFCSYCGKKQIPTQKKRKKRANGMGSVIKKAGNRAKPWEAQKAGVYIGSYATRAEAEQALLEIIDIRVTETLNLTFKQVYEKWRPEHQRNITEKGMGSYETAYRHCQPLYDRAFRKLRVSDFQEIIIQMESKGLSKSSCEKVVQLFGQLSKWAMRDGICHTNYAQFVSITAKQKKEKIAFTLEQICAISKSPNQASAVALVLLATGCRPNELFSATLENCHDTYFISGSKTEAGKNRVIPVSEFGMGAYKTLLQAAREKNAALLIDGYAGNKQYKNYVRRDWKTLMDECGIADMTPYNCRHTYATLAVQAGVKPEILQKILGHADYSTTVDVYTHLDLDDILKESTKLAVTDTLQTR